MRYRFTMVYGLLALIAFLSTAMAQTSRGTLSGTVTDTSGAVVANATVTLKQTETGITRQTTSNEAGIYRFDAVDLGSYSVTVDASGFGQETRTGIEVAAARTSNVNFSLKVGAAKEIVTVEASGFEVALQTSEQVRGANFSTIPIQNLPLAGLDTLTLAQLAPGVTLANSNSINQNGTFNFSVNGQRPRGNNFMIDGVENNDISVTGPAFTITNPDAVHEVNVQTANFSAEFGRAGGAVINQITNSGTNSYHGSVAWVYTGSAFHTLNHSDVLAGRTRPPRSVENVPDFTFGGPVIIPKLYDGHAKTFFFVAGQWDRLYGTATRNLTVATPDGVALLQTIASQCPNAALYLQAIGSLRGDPARSPVPMTLQVPSSTGTCTNSTRAGLNSPAGFGLVGRAASQSSLDNNHQIRVDHTVSDKQNMSFRWLYDKSTTGPTLNNFSGFDNNFEGITLSGLFSDTYMINSRATNEFRFNYGRIGFNFPLAAPDTFHSTLPNYGGLGVTGFGGATNIPQFRFANNWQYQDTMSLVRGKHTFRFGADFLRQLARQHPPFNERGSFVYATSGSGATAVTAFTNFIDDFGGRTGSLNRQFGSSIYHPNLFRQSYFFQDSWKTTNNLTLNLGLRYEFFGTPVNAFTVAAFTDYDPVNFAAPHKVNPDKNNFAPSVGFAWNPKGENFLNRMMGGEKTVWRGGFQVSYDTWFNNLLSNIAGSSPNTLGGSIGSTTVGRGAANFSTLFSGIAPTPATKESLQQNLFLKDMRNPYTDRWSLGMERELPYDMIMDVSYVGSVSHKLFRTIDMNPVVNSATGDRLHTELQSSSNPAVRTGQGIRTVRASSANSNYEALQFNLNRRFKSTPLGTMLMTGSYTYAHYLDDVSDVFAFDSTPSSFQSLPQVLGFGTRIDHGNSDFDRRHVGVIGVVWDIRGPHNGFLGQALGGWSVSGISHWQTGQPFTVGNGVDRNGDGQSGPDRADIGSPSAPLNTRGILNSACGTGYSNPDLPGNPCVSPTSVHFLEGIGLPNANTVARNSLRTNGIDNLQLSVAKKFKFSEQGYVEYRLDMNNALNTINFGDVPAATVHPGVIAPTFLDFTQDQSIGRSMRMRLKVNF